MNNKELLVNQIIDLSIDEICSKTGKTLNIDNLKELKNKYTKEQLLNLKNRELALLMRTCWICPYIFGLDDICFQVSDCVDCVEYALTSIELLVQRRLL